MASITQLPSGQWRALIRVHGNPPVSLTRRTKAACVRDAMRVEDSIRSGTYWSEEVNTCSMPDLLNWYEKHVEPRRPEQSLMPEKTRIKTLRESPILACRRIDTLTAADVIAYVDQRKADGLSSSSIIKELTILSTAIDTGCDLMQIDIPANPVKKAKSVLSRTKTLVDNPHRERRVTNEEIRRLNEVLSAQMRLVLVLLTETGMRRSELYNCQPDHLMDSKTLLLIPLSKSKGPCASQRIVPLSPLASKCLLQLFEINNGKAVSYSRPDGISQAWEIACKRAGIKDLHLHDLRHECASRLFESGWSIPEVAVVTGHKDWAMLKRYTQLDPSRLAARLRENQLPKQHQDSETDEQPSGED